MDEAQLATDPWIGIELDGRYRICQKLGEGGMGVVYKAEHILIEKAVAVKILRAEFAKKQDLLARFHQEARSASRIRHEHIVDITDFGKTPEGSAFFVMEYLEGTDLAGLIESGPVSYQRAIPIVGQVCSALSAAHDAGIVHRDLKPENIFLSSQHEVSDFVKILDFGIAKISNLAAAGEIGERLTKPGMIFGTPEYMSPEQAGGSDLDRRVDIYALGVIFFEMLTGDVPFRDSSFMGVLRQHMMSPIPSVSERIRGTPPAIDKILKKALAKHPKDRFQTMLELWNALEAALPEVTGSRHIRFESPLAPINSPDSRRQRSISPPLAQAPRESERERMMSPPPDASGQRRFSPVPRLESPPTMLGEAGRSPVGDSKQRPGAFSTSTRGTPSLRSGGYGVVKPGGKSRATPPPRPAFTSGAYQVPPRGPAASEPASSSGGQARNASLPSGGYRVIGKGGGPPSLPSGGYRSQGTNAPNPSFTSGGYRSPTASPKASLPSGGYQTAGAGRPAFTSERAEVISSHSAPARAPASTLLLETASSPEPLAPQYQQPSYQEPYSARSLPDEDEDVPTQMGPLEMLEETFEAGSASVKPVFTGAEGFAGGPAGFQGYEDMDFGPPRNAPVSNNPSMHEIQEAPTRIAVNPTGAQPLVSPRFLENPSVEEQPTHVAVYQAPMVQAAFAPVPFAGSPEPVPFSGAPQPAPFSGAPAPEFAPPPEIQPPAAAPPVNIGSLQAAAVPVVAHQKPSRGGRIFLITAITTLFLGGGAVAAYFFILSPSQKIAAAPEEVVEGAPTELSAATNANPTPPTTKQTEGEEAASTPASSPVPEPIPPPIEEPPPPPVAVKQDFFVVIPASPASARIYLGRRSLGSQGKIKLQGKEGQKVRLRVKAGGYSSASVTVVLGKTTQVSKITLNKIEKKPAKGGCDGPILNPFGCD